MIELERILVVVEPDSDEQPALERAIQLTRYADSKLELMLADYTSYLEDGHYFDPIQAQTLRYEHGKYHLQKLEELAAPLRDEGLEVTVTTAWGNPPYAEIVNRIRDSKPSLVIKSTRHHGKISRLLLSNADWELVRYCPAPLLLVKSQAWPANPVFLAAVDPYHLHDKPAQLDDTIIESAKNMAAISGGSVHLFHSAWIPPLAGVVPLVVDANRETYLLQDLAEKHGIPAQKCHWSELEVSTGLPAQVLALQASAVVMGAVSRSRLDRILIGNTAEKVIDRVECDVLVIKPEQMKVHGNVLL